VSVGSVEQDIATIARISAVPTILRVISEATGMRLSLISRVTPDRWTACAVLDTMSFGLKPGDELDVATTLCSQVRDTFEPVVIDHASDDPQYCRHPTPKMYGFESYIAVPIFRRNGKYFGNVCALDSRPARVNEPKTVSMIKLFADLISLQIEDEERHARGQAALVDEKSTAELREQFIALLGHDLRNPLSAIVMGARQLERQSDEGDRKVIVRIRQSVRRITGLVDDILDFARGRLGGGIAIEAGPIKDLDARLRHVVDELASVHPERAVRFVAEGCGSLRGDAGRIEQLLSNLLANAIEHSVGSDPVDVAVRGAGDFVCLTVTNRGNPIAPEILPRLFQPYYRGAGGSPSAGLGLGLYIVAEIARSHGGTVGVTSSAEAGTTFTVTLPR
jgi:sigma-B regulation protein RsbU (phosphoserine phosphatase)